MSDNTEIQFCLMCEKLTPTIRDEVISQMVIRYTCGCCGAVKEERCVS